MIPEQEIEYRVECLPEEVPIEGNCSAIDPVEDAAMARWIRDQLRQGNEWAWCCIKVSAIWDDFVATDYLGCCSYMGEEDFMTPGGYYDDMKKQVTEDLQQQVHETRVTKPQVLDLLTKGLELVESGDQKLGMPTLRHTLYDAADELHVEVYRDHDGDEKHEATYRVELVKVE